MFYQLSIMIVRFPKLFCLHIPGIISLPGRAKRGVEVK